MKPLFALVLCTALWLPACATSGQTNSASSMKAQNPTDDANITARVKTVLLNDPQINATKIDVSSSGGVVTMSGTVKSQADADRAVQLARGVEGVKDVKSTVRIGG